MKKPGLALFLLLQLLLACLPADSHSLRETGPSSSQALRQYAVSFAAHPHTELELFQPLPGGGPGYRPSPLPGHLAVPAWRHPAPPATGTIHRNSYPAPTVKEYLTHIYPSHNFW